MYGQFCCPIILKKHRNPYNNDYKGLLLKKNENICFNLITSIYFESIFYPKNIYNLKNFFEDFFFYYVQEGQVILSWQLNVLLSLFVYFINI
jgi:hypothetical protein